MTIIPDSWKVVDITPHPLRRWLEMQRDIDTMTNSNVTLDIRF
jgi:hypothetical protein